MIEIYSDIVDLPEMDEPNKKNLERIEKSLGWVSPEEHEGKQGWEVVTGEGSFMWCEKQENAMILSELVQIHERLKRK